MSQALSPMLALHGLAHIAFGIRAEMRWGTGLLLACRVRRGGEGYTLVLDLVMGWVLLVLKVRLHRVLFTSHYCIAISRHKKSLYRF